MGANKGTLERWQLIKVLGSGGFGQVSLWCDHSTGQKIAIKKLLNVALKDVSVKAKLTERWCNEVEIMKKLNHPNIVNTLKSVPPELNIVESLPVLAMEYCSNGDLRQASNVYRQAKVLNKAENCCGLCESDILNILKDVSNGLAYLHSCKIIHRDIKPDNIVLQEKDSKIIYKLIDLGYGKALDQSSLSKSFVGTVQYIAPELFMGKAYTSSVDYWSFGLMTHEIITGYRPFLPGRTPSEWMKLIQNKKRNIVRVVENSSREVLFYKHISRKNHSSRCFLEQIEKWLQLALDWDGQTRGRDTENNRLVIFENLSEIIYKKLINVFSLPTYETLTYEIMDETDILDLKRWLKVNTHIEEGDQVLLFSNGKCLNTNGNLLKNLEYEKLNRSVVALFLFDNSGPMSVRTEVNSIPVFLDEFKSSSNREWSYRKLKKCYADSVYFLQSQATLYRYFLEGIKVKINNTKQKTSDIESLYEDLVEKWNQIESFGHFLSLSHKIDLENYIYYRKAGKLKSSSLARKWIQNAIDVSSKITQLRSLFNKTQQRQLVVLAKERCRNLDFYQSNNNHTQQTSLDILVKKGEQLWENLSKLSKNDNTILVSNGSATELIIKAVEETNKFLKSDMLKTLFIKIWEADESLARFFTQLTNIYKSTDLLTRLIQNAQIERQKEVWSLIENAKNEYYMQVGNIELEDLNAPNCEKNQKIVRSLVSTKNSLYDEFENLDLRESEISKIISSCDPPFTSCTLKTSHVQNVNETYSIIEDNNRLRYRIQEVQQSCSQLVKDIVAQKWDFV